MGLIKDTMRALGFLSRMPLSASWFKGYDGPLSDAVRGFPLAGMLIALPASLVLLIAQAFDLPDSITALLVIVALMIATGALHEDGLADVADGFYGGATVNRRLEIMKDSATGSYGALSLVVSVFLRAALFATIIDELDTFQAVLVLIGTEAGSRSVMVKLWQSLPSVRLGGVADQSGTPSVEAANYALIIGAVVLAICYGAAGGLFGIVVAVCLTALVYLGFSALCRDKIGGQTGDTLGAMQQLATNSLLLGLVIVL
ncbi:adenosylcobinamide-GDP ribazoletransferase [Phyllobacterium endophyticum]|uniref:Adenosylcobinamide-GDP ribazoletransferase n=1 Tax=Phyllobacterium endophyticum TaxID=1149773 RepID=A0A2P7AU09_9HYPH|nr:adenosylcobinamide-GDP ribazoletransferase [Phyllobacterium endophyticum]MBB3234132.1 adenosylcobinamide-GDP ribazoletransferase [Phyllobacterium endophyticum]PSH57700.1 adenosylcobinamide-GDP ribazoletransferase [Phyllobacterium endophyticum]TYR43893.1 adenosylcobinamide-GDP ribazoletransferase [Phyllobacterium endophyticum]